MEQKDYRLAAIMYTDIAGFSRMMERDEAGTLELLRFHNELIGEIVGRHHGTVIKTIGDALLVDFKNTVEALQSALEIQDQLYAHNKEHPKLPLLVRIGLHLGDIYFFENDALGEGINIAARLQAQARPGCICLSQDVYNIVLNKLEFRAEKLGKVSLKNITKEVHAYEITTPNVEFDPDRDKPRPGYKPGSYLEGGRAEGSEESPPVSGSAARAAPPEGPAAQPRAASAATAARTEPPIPPAAPEPPAAAGGAVADEAAPEPDREYSPEGSRNVLAEIRAAILADIKREGRRLSVDEALERYGYYGVEAREVIASLAERGLLTRRREGPSPASPGSAGSELGRSIEAAVHGIVTEIERSVERSMDRSGAPGGAYGYSMRHDERLERVKRKVEQHLERRAVKERYRQAATELPTGQWDKGLAEDESWNAGGEELSRDFDRYRDSVVDRARKLRGGFVGNLLSFLAVNAGLWFINLSTSASFPWAGIVSAAWGIGLCSSLAASVRAEAKRKEVEAMPSLDRGQLETYKKLNRVKDSLVQHGVSTFTVPFLLGFINLITSPSFLWFLIPTGAMVLSFLSHLASYSATRPRLERELKASLGVEGGWRKVVASGKSSRAVRDELGPYAELYREAELAKTAILSQSKAGSPLDGDLGPSLDGYLGQVKLLAQSAHEIDRIVDAIPMADLERDKAALLSKEAAATSPALKTEYRAGVEEIEKQEKSYEELKNQSELIRLRLRSSVNQLKQMRIDLARLKAAGEGGETGGVDRLRERTEELSRYLEDLRKGYDEGAKDPFAELEALARAEEERKAAQGQLPGSEQ